VSSWRGVLDTALCDKVCQWLATGRWFSLGIPGSSTNTTDRHDITEILLKLALNTIKLNQTHTLMCFWLCLYRHVLFDVNRLVLILKVIFDTKNKCLPRPHPPTYLLLFLERFLVIPCTKFWLSEIQKVNNTYKLVQSNCHNDMRICMLCMTSKHAMNVLKNSHLKWGSS